MQSQKNIIKNLKFMNAVIFVTTQRIHGITELINQFVKNVQKLIKCQNYKNHHQIINRNQFSLVYNGWRYKIGRD